MTTIRGIASAIWGNALAKEFILMLASAIAVQAALGFNNLLGSIDTAKDWGDLLTSLKAWAGSFAFALVITALKQALAWGVAHLAGEKL